MALAHPRCGAGGVVRACPADVDRCRSVGRARVPRHRDPHGLRREPERRADDRRGARRRAGRRCGDLWGSGATSYRETMTCTGSGVVRCGQLAALQPGTWVHRLSVTVTGSATQQQAQRFVLVAGSPAEVSNALVWTVYPQTFVVQAASAAELQARLDDATAYARENPGPALVIFSADAFPGAIAPQ